MIQELLGHKDVITTMIYIHVLNRGPHGVRSPADISNQLNSCFSDPLTTAILGGSS
jgi:hypothetical protein